MNTLEIVASRYYELPKADIQKVGDLTLVFSSNEQKGFGEVHCTEQAIYCFYMEPGQEDIINKSLYVFVYDWELNPKVCYTMQAFYTNGFVTADDRYIYASTFDPKTDKYVLSRYETNVSFR